MELESKLRILYNKMQSVTPMGLQAALEYVIIPLTTLLRYFVLPFLQPDVAPNPMCAQFDIFVMCFWSAFWLTRPSYHIQNKAGRCRSRPRGASGLHCETRMHSPNHTRNYIYTRFSSAWSAIYGIICIVDSASNRRCFCLWWWCSGDSEGV